MQVNAILFDVQSIQKYIFANNKLKANVGASYIVDRLFENVLCDEVIKNIGVAADTTSWLSRGESLAALPTPVYVAYIGGGNALVLIDEAHEALVADIIKQFTTLVLTKYPSLKVGATSGTISLDKDKFSSDLGVLYSQLKTNQYTLHPIVTPANTGLTTICDFSGDVADTTEQIGEKRLVATSFSALASFKTTVEWIIDHYDVLDAELELKPNMMPIRPIIVGGDDITFICNARIAVQTSQFLMQQLLSDADGMSIASCAGIAVIPTSYPFFRGYEMAEQLCDSAKSKMRAYNESHTIPESCWMDFAFLHGETAPTLEQFFANEYSSLTGNMHFGPYRVYGRTESVASGDIEGLPQVLDCTAQFNAGKVMAHNKVKELRSVLQDNEHMWTVFLEQLRNTGASLPNVAGWDAFTDKLWAKIDGHMRTPYTDAIELMDYVLPGLE